MPESKIVELGSGLGNIHEVIPNCLRTDLFPNPWIDQIENAYQLSFADESVSDLILTDVFHHLKYPGTALKEFSRVLRKGGRVIMLEPCMSALGLLVYGILHDEPIAVTKEIEWDAPEDWSPEQIDYYAAQGNASRIFLGKRFRHKLGDWQKIRNAASFCDRLRGFGWIFQAAVISHLGTASDTKTGKGTGSVSLVICHSSAGYSREMITGTAAPLPAAHTERSHLRGKLSLRDNYTGCAS